MGMPIFFLLENKTKEKNKVFFPHIFDHCNYPDSISTNTKRILRLLQQF